MGLYERLIGLEEPKIPVHQYAAAVNEVQRGQLTKAQLATAFGLSAAEKTDSDAVVDRLAAPLSPLAGEELHEVLMLAEYNSLVYGTVSALKARLGT